MIEPMKRFLLLLLLIFFMAAHAAEIGLSPPRLELVGRPGETLTETVSILTTASSPQQIQVDLSDWTLDPEGNLLVLPPASLEFSSAAWLEPEAGDFILEADSSQEFRVSVTIPQDAAYDGTYQSMVFFTVVPPPTETQGVGVITTTRIGLTIYVTIAATEQGGSELVDFFQPDDGNLTVAVANTGNTVMRLGGFVELRDEEGNSKYRLEVPDVPVLRESERELSIPLPEGIEPGFYVALALIEDSRGGILAGELPIQVP